MESQLRADTVCRACRAHEREPSPLLALQGCCSCQSLRDLQRRDTWCEEGPTELVAKGPEERMFGQPADLVAAPPPQTHPSPEFPGEGEQESWEGGVQKLPGTPDWAPE